MTKKVPDPFRESTNPAMLLTFVASVFLATPVQGQVEVVDETGTLRGLEGVEVLVESMDIEADWHGFSTVSIRNDVERQLKAANIPVLASDTGRPQPWLYVNVQMRAGGDRRTGILAVSMSLQLKQAVTLTRNPKLLGLATTWETSDGVNILQEKNLEQLRDRLQQLVDRFVHAYKVANTLTESSW